MENEPATMADPVTRNLDVKTDFFENRFDTEEVTGRREIGDGVDSLVGPLLILDAGTDPQVPQRPLLVVGLLISLPRLVDDLRDLIGSAEQIDNSTKQRLGT